KKKKKNSFFPRLLRFFGITAPFPPNCEGFQLIDGLARTINQLCYLAGIFVIGTAPLPNWQYHARSVGEAILDCYVSCLSNLL
ncbi:MAG: hypothetical protein OXF24_00155, partial [Hyphomicrobiales bacterium]|nr:hypothetical protein [Hyphomicrobiales bacterium]